MAFSKIGTTAISDDAVSLAKMATGTDGNVITYDASGNPVAIATGNDGQVLTSTGAGSPPAFETAGGGATGLITSGSWSTSSDNIDIASCFSNSDGYDAYKFILNGLSVTSDTQLWLRFKSASGNISDSDYEYAFFQRRSGDVEVTVQSTGDTKILFPPSNLWGGSGDYGYNTEITFYDPTQGGYTNISQQDSYYNSNGDAAMSYGGGLLKQSTDVTGFKMIIAAGSANTSGDVGQYFLYGWKNS